MYCIGASAAWMRKEQDCGMHFDLMKPLGRVAASKPTLER
jgi:hypothetical protein